MDSVMLLPAEKENGHVNPSRITMLLSRLQFGAKMNVLMGLANSTPKCNTRQIRQPVVVHQTRSGVA